MTKGIGRFVYEAELPGKPTGEPAFERITIEDTGLKEAWFRDAVFANPELVIEPCRDSQIIEPGEQWHPWATEHSLDAGAVDVLLLSSSGRVGMVETKLSYNRGGRREVVAQILDYALALQDTPFEDLPKLPQVPSSPHSDDVRDALASGRFLMIIAGDELDARAVRLSEAMLARHLTAEWDLAMVDLNIYARRGAVRPVGHVLVVPELRGLLVHDTRQVVRVIVQGEKPAAKIQVERVPEGSGRANEDWNVDRFVAAMPSHAVPLAIQQFVTSLRALADQDTDTSLDFGAGRTGRLLFKRYGKSIFVLAEDGTFEARPRAYVEVAFGEAAANAYLETVKTLFGPEY